MIFGAQKYAPGSQLTCFRSQALIRFLLSLKYGFETFYRHGQERFIRFLCVSLRFSGMES